jgi:DNA-binding MarR family transcriptional regulator
VTDARWLDAQEARAWRGLTRMQTQLYARLNRELLRSSGLSASDYAVLVCLSEAPQGRMRPFELGAELRWEKSRLSHHIARMERRGLIERRECDADARGLFVVITGSGRSAIEDAAPQHVEHVRRNIIDLLTPEQLDALGDVTEIVLKNLDYDAEDCDS